VPGKEGQGLIDLEARDLAVRAGVGVQGLLG
jgi:propanediol dehydratase large subunit